MKPTKMLKWVVLASVGTLVACGGTSAIGSGDEDPNGMGKSGSTGMNEGGHEPGTGAKPGMGTGGAMAAGGTGQSMGGATQACMSDFDCATDDYCEMCADGSYLCPKAFCSAGQCVQARGTCAQACEDDKQCPVIDVACTMCDDGTTACPTSQCVMGQCQTNFPGCGGIDPCDGLPCGAECKSCGPDGMCAPNIASYCSAEGKCQPGLPQCAGPGMCNTAMDCGTPPPNCVACGNDTCAEFACIEGKCVFSCPPDPEPQCKVTEDCPAMDAVCKQCPNGGCAIQACISQSCQLVCPL
jgi:hypothetical protein